MLRPFSVSALTSLLHWRIFAEKPGGDTGAAVHGSRPAGCLWFLQRVFIGPSDLPVDTVGRTAE